MQVILFFRIMMSITLFVFPIWASADVEPECTKWFGRLKLEANAPDCLNRCSTSAVDLGTFVCTDRCDELCGASFDCKEFRNKIEKSYTNEAPASWDEKSEKLTKWTELEKQKVTRTLLKLPRILVEKNEFKLHRMAKSAYPGNLAATKRNSIAVFDDAFRSKVPLERVLAHELAHVYWNNLKPTEKDPYQIAASWFEFDGNMVFGRAANLKMEADSEISVTEDFANNVEYFLFDPQKLRQKLPSLFGWFQTNFGAKLILGEKCVEKKK